MIQQTPYQRFEAGVLVESHPPRILPGLGTDRLTIPADGTTPATAHYAREASGPHAWTVNGAAHAEPATLDAASGLYWSEIEVTASTPGPVEITVGGETITVEAV